MRIAVDWFMLDRKKNTEKNYKELKDFALDRGADLFGVADIKKLKKDFILDKKLIAGIDKAISIGVRLSERIFEDVTEHPTRLYFHHYKTANMFLDQLAFRTSNFIQKKGYLALPIPASQIVDWQKQTSHLSHKAVGYFAGLGWIGRNNLLVNKEFGSQFRLVTILTNMPIDIDKPLKEDCQTCKRCIAVCPASAIKEKKEDFNHIGCFEKLKEFQKSKFSDQYICGICIGVCNGKM